MKVSVIISTYNRKTKLKKAIESVLKQTFQDFEIIIVDDKSTDGTHKEIKAFKDKRITYIRRKRNFGSDTRPKNEGIKAAKGEYINFLDDDNEFRPDHLAILVKELDANPELSGVYGDRFLVDAEERRRLGLGVFHDYDPVLLLQRNYIDTSDMLIRKDDLLYVGGFDERYAKYIDWNLWLRLAKAGKIFMRIPLVITDYAMSNNSKSKLKLTKNEQKYFEKNGEFKNLPDWDPYNIEIRLPYLGNIENAKVAIFSLTYDRLEYTKACFESLYKTAGYPFDHYVIDNGSKDGTKEYLQKLVAEGKVHMVIDNLDNKGISIASNQGLDVIMKANNVNDALNGVKRYDIIGKVDNDAFFHNKGWLAKMVEIWNSNHQIALSCYVQGLRDNPGGAPRMNYGLIVGELVGNTKHLGGICHFVDSKAYQNFRWDEDSMLHGVQDLEISQYLQQNGYQMAYLENWFVEHYKGTDGQHKDYPAYFDRRRIEKTTKYEADK